MAIPPAWTGIDSENELFKDRQNVLLVDVRNDLNMALTNLDNAMKRIVGSSDPTARNFVEQIVSIRESVLKLVRRLSNRYP